MPVDVVGLGIRRHDEEDAIGTLVGPLNDRSIVERTLDDFDAATHLGLKSRRIARDHPDRFASAQHEFNDLAVMSGTVNGC